MKPSKKQKLETERESYLVLDKPYDTIITGWSESENFDIQLKIQISPHLRTEPKIVNSILVAKTTLDKKTGKVKHESLQLSPCDIKFIGG